MYLKDVVLQLEDDYGMPPTNKHRLCPCVRGRGRSKGSGHRKGRLGRLFDDRRPESAIGVVEEAGAISEEGTLSLGYMYIVVISLAKPSDYVL